MTLQTEARNGISTQETIESNDNDQVPSGSHGAHWILTVALVAMAGLIAALVIESSNSSSSKDVTTPAVTMDPQFDQDSHREPSPAARADALSANRSHREADLFPAAPAGAAVNESQSGVEMYPSTGGAASMNRAHREADLYPAVSVVDPRLDQDFHRDPNG